ncbi:MAG: mycothiol synthase [Mycobacteriaceae bacterium]|uniref:mycothiol synthase n=1 Tax=Corynebacterium sp. TaxID=1720 RepID=UPI003F9B4E60
MENTQDALVYRELNPADGGAGPALELLRTVAEADGVEAYSEAFLRSLEGTSGYRHLVAETVGGDDGGSVVGLLSVNPSNVSEIAVRPDVRRRGIATGLLREMGRMLDGEQQLSVWSHGALDEAEGFAGNRGARTVRELLKMSVDCSTGSEGGRARREEMLTGRDGAATTVTETGLRVMDFTESREAFGADTVDDEWLRVNNESFAWHPEQGGWDLGRLRSARDVDWFDPAGLLFLWGGDELLGFHWTKRPEGDTHGEVYVVCLADAARGRGLGTPLTILGIGYLLDGGAEAVDLYVEGDNVPAVATYRKLGFEIVHRDVVYRGIL